MKLDNSIPIPDDWKHLKFAPLPDSLDVGQSFVPELLEPDEDGCKVAPPSRSLRNKIQRWEKKMGYKVITRTVKETWSNDEYDYPDVVCFRVWRKE